jgi:excisionase family DNA binding protein
MPEDLIDAGAAARLLRVHISTIYRWALTGRLRAWRVGSRYRVSQAEVLASVREVPSVASPGGGHARAVAELRRAGVMK